MGVRELRRGFPEPPRCDLIASHDTTVAIKQKQALWRRFQYREQDLLFVSEFVATLTQRPFHFALLSDVGVCSKPTDHLVFFIFDRESARKEPSVLAILAAQRKGIFPRLSCVKGDFDTFDYSAHFIRVMNFLPTPSLHLFERRAGVIVPAIIVPKNVSFLVCHPCKLRNGIGECAKLSLVLT